MTLDEVKQAWTDFAKLLVAGEIKPSEDTKAAFNWTCALLTHIKLSERAHAAELAALEKATIERCAGVVKQLETKSRMIAGHCEQEPSDERLRIVTAIEPFARLGGGFDMQAFHDLEDDVVIYSNSGKAITAGDVRGIRELFASLTDAAASCMHFRRAKGE